VKSSGTFTLYEIWGLLGRHRCRWDDNIERFLKEIHWDGTYWTELAQVGGQWCSPVNRLRSLPVP